MMRLGYISKLKGRKVGCAVPIVCVGALALLAGAMLCPVQSGGVNAVEAVGGDLDGPTTGSVSVEFGSSDKLTETVSVTAGKPFASDTKTLKVTPTGTVDKYSIYVQSTSSNNGSLVGVANKETIAPITDKTTGVAFSSIGENQWGYALEVGSKSAESMSYKGMNGSSSVVSAYDSGANPSGEQTFTLAFAANIGNNKPADSYHANVVVSVAANPGEVTSGFGGVYYMQDLTPTICKGISGTNVEGQLVDRRDGKAYYVAKLKDNNCWMVQNLDYDGPSGAEVALVNWQDTNTIAQYYDPGDYFWTPTAPASWTACAKTSTGLSTCTGNTWLNTGNDMHYHIGNYYSWLAATNGSSGTDSICPKNWKLPTSNNANSGSFGLLVSGLGSGAAWVSAITNEPYYFVPGGDVNSGSLNNAGLRGRYWSSTAYNNTNEYYLGFNSSNVDLSQYYYRYNGYSVRCLVQGS